MLRPGGQRTVELVVIIVHTSQKTKYILMVINANQEESNFYSLEHDFSFRTSLSNIIMIRLNRYG